MNQADDAAGEHDGADGEIDPNKQTQKFDLLIDLKGGVIVAMAKRVNGADRPQDRDLQDGGQAIQQEESGSWMSAQEGLGSGKHQIKVQADLRYGQRTYREDEEQRRAAGDLQPVVTAHVGADGDDAHQKEQRGRIVGRLPPKHQPAIPEKSAIPSRTR